MRKISFLFLTVGCLLTICRPNKVTAQELRLPLSGGTLVGELLLPETPAYPADLVIFISGSGPTDRNGNQGDKGSHCIGMLADSLAALGVASFRYDKRGAGSSQFPDLSEETLRFDTFVSDLLSWTAFFEIDKRFHRIIYAGHSEGALIATLAAQRTGNVHGVITIAGAGRSADVLMLEQMRRQPAFVAVAADSLFRQLREGKETLDPPPYLQSLFRPSVLPYVRSWITIDPAAAFAALAIPTMVIAGAKDIQVTLVDAQLLHDAGQKSALHIFDDMNHVLKDVDDLTDNYLSYLDMERPLTPGLATCIADWINGRKQTADE